MRNIDLHCDTILFCFEGNQSLRQFGGHINLEKLISGGCLAQCFALFIPTYETAVQYLHREYDPWELYGMLLDCYRRNLADSADYLRPALSADQVRENREKGFLSSILTVEDGVEIDGKLSRFDRVYDDGVRMMTLTWNYENCMGYPNSSDPKEHSRGLKPFGVEAVRKMNELGMIIDISHLSEGGFYDVAAHSKKPFVASHSCCRALKDHPRNLTDDQLRVLADAGGVVGINFYDQFLGGRDGYTAVNDVVRHILHVRDMAGVDAIAFGSDFDGIESELEFGDYAGFPQILRVLEQHFTEDEIDKISSENFLRVFSAQN